MRNPDDLPEEIIIECDKPHKYDMSYESNEHSDIGNFAFKLFFEEQLPKLQSGLQIQSYFDAFCEKTVEFFKLYDPKCKTKDCKHDKDGHERVKTRLYSILIHPGFSLTPGQIVALAGDFFADPNKPIAFGKDEIESDKKNEQETYINKDTKEARFISAYNTLINNTLPVKKLDKIIRHIQGDAEAVDPETHWYIKFKKQAKDTLEIGNLEYASEISENGFWHSSYFKLAMINFDHFGAEAVSAFLTGHKLAIKKAREAGSIDNEQEKIALLKEAFLYMLYACHFLTDLYSAGHIRTPRKQILNYLIGMQNSNGSIPESFNINADPDLGNISSLNLAIAGLFARKMHDIDNKDGVYVRYPNTQESPWLSCGDNNYYRKENSVNAVHAINTMIEALKDLVFAYNKQETQLDKNIAKYIPTDIGLEKENRDKEPLFKVENNKLLCRGDLASAIKAEGVVDGAKRSISYVPVNYALLGCRFFNVKVVPAATTAAKAVVKTEQSIAKAATEIKDEIVQKSEAAIGQVQELTQEGIKELYDKLLATQAKCNLL